MNPSLALNTRLTKRGLVATPLRFFFRSLGPLSLHNIFYIFFGHFDEKKNKRGWGIILQGYSVSHQKSEGKSRGCWSPAIFEITIWQKLFLLWSWILHFNVRNVNFFFISKTAGEILTFRTFLAKNSIWLIFHWKFSNCNVIVTSYIFSMYGKRRPTHW